MSAKERAAPLWTPGPELVERATITRYTRWLASERGLALDEGYGALWRWSVTEIEDFWASVWEFFDVRASAPYERVLGTRAAGGPRAMPGAEWFPGARLSYAEHVFRGKDDGATAIRHASELRPLERMTWGELRSLTERIAGGLRALGVNPGDRVVAYLPNVPEAVAAFLACASIGATWSSCSPDFGARSVIDRFAQIEPQVLITVDGYRYGGRDFDRTDVVASLEAAMPSVEHTVVLPYLSHAPDLSRLERPFAWEDLLLCGQGHALAFEQLPFDHPLWVLYSSGTTGLPKAIVHGQGGILLEHLKKLHLHVNAQAGDRVFWFTTTGWMMWNFLVGALLTPAEIVLYDGSPAGGALWDLADRAGITCLGTSAAYLNACLKAAVDPRAGRDLASLRSVGSTGSPLSPEAFRWVYDHLGADTWLFSTSGGTDVCTAFVGGCPLLPVHAGELQCRALGAKVEALDDAGNSLIGEVGELVITKPMPSMPLRLWNDPSGERLRESYFSTYPGVWRHGDWIEISDRGTAVIHGRSDATINRGGVRMGTSEIYRVVLGVAEIVDALVVDVPTSAGESWMPLFVVLRAGAELDARLTDELLSAIRADCSPRHVPDEVIAVPDLPRTLSGKLLELPVKRILMGSPVEQVASRGSLANPGALDPFVALAAERGAG